METRLTQWRRFISGPEDDHPSGDAIVASWRRSESAGIDPQPERVAFRQLTDGELHHRLSDSAALVEAAKPVLERLLKALPGETMVCYVTDRHGTVLHAIGNELLRKAFGLSPGYDWSEKAMGTNGAGTCLATGQPTAVVGPEHFLEAFHNCTCTAAPILDAAGTLVGALDASSTVDDAQPGQLERVIEAAREVEERLGGLRTAER